MGVITVAGCEGCGVWGGLTFMLCLGCWRGDGYQIEQALSK